MVIDGMLPWVAIALFQTILLLLDSYATADRRDLSDLVARVELGRTLDDFALRLHLHQQRHPTRSRAHGLTRPVQRPRAHTSPL